MDVHIMYKYVKDGKTHAQERDWKPAPASETNFLPGPRTQGAAAMASTGSALPVILLQLAFYIGLWEVFFSKFLMEKFEKYAQQQAWWPAIVKRKGALGADGQRDFVLLGVLAVHHATSGTLMCLGAYLGRGDLWAQGALMEMGFELMDIIANIRGVWPYKPGHMDLDTRIALVFHHIPGLLTVIPIAMYGIYDHPSLQKLGAWLLVAAAGSSAGGCFIYTRNFKDPTEMKQAAVTHHFVTALFLWARFAVFPFEAWTLYEFVSHRPGVHPWFPTALYWGSHALNIFNVVVGLKIFQKTVNHGRKAFWDMGVDLDDNKAVIPGDQSKKKA